MEEFEELDINELTSKKKNFRISIKRTLIGLISATLIYSTIPNVEYKIALYRANNNPFIEEVMMDASITKEEQIAKIFEEAIRSNNKLEDEVKEIVIDAFTTEVIDRAGMFFSDKTIRNMYAVASTQRITEMSDFTKEYGWWNGFYNPYTNTYALHDKPENVKKSLIAHEQLHAILKNGMINTGFTNGLEGFGLNEGMTTLFGENDYSYLDETNAVNVIGIIMGYDTLITYYVNSDLQGLKNELANYISKEEVDKLIYNIDSEVFNGFYETLAEKNNLSFDNEYYEENRNRRKAENKKILEKLFENKYKMSSKESEFGKLIFNSEYFMTKEELDNAERYYSFSFKDKDSVKIIIRNRNPEGVAKGIICKTKEEIMDNEDKTAETIVSEEFKIDSVYGGYISEIGEDRCLIILKGFSTVFPEEDLKDSKIEEKFDTIISRIEATNNIEKDEDKEFY